MGEIVVPLAPGPTDPTTVRWTQTAQVELDGVVAEINRLNSAISQAQSDLASQQNTQAELQRLLVDVSSGTDATAQRYAQGIRGELAAVGQTINNTQSA